MSESAREKNRRMFPETAALKDKLEGVGLSVTVQYASENGHEVGREPEWIKNLACKPRIAAKIEEGSK